MTAGFYGVHLHGMGKISPPVTVSIGPPTLPYITGYPAVKNVGTVEKKNLCKDYLITLNLG